MRLSAVLLLLCLGALLLLALYGDLIGRRQRHTEVSAQLTPAREGATLFVLVHGYNPRQQLWSELARTLEPHGAVLRVGYNAGALSNAEPAVIARRIDEEIAAAVQQTKAGRVVLVAHSMGALLARRTLLDARPEGWQRLVQRVVLLAGVSRGWDITGPAPDDASAPYRLGMRVLYWGGRLVRRGELLFSFERGSPLVANLRIRWLKHLRDTAHGRQLEVVQLLGDIDDIVRREDNADLQVMSSDRYALLKVRGTGHGDIIDFNAKHGTLGSYRRDKLLLAATGSFEQLRRATEELPAATDPGVNEVLFVLHGIRDLGRWSAQFERSVRTRWPQREGSLAIVSSRYGYLGMGPFLFEDVRNRYVRWFMDQYTEVLARYPNLKRDGIRFFGHSNGTWIVAEALRQYETVEMASVVFAGSVVPQRYDWSALGPRVGAVRNYVGTEDWVVALFPRLFELQPMLALGNDLGSAGFNGFTDARVQNVRFVAGEHSAFESRVDEIVDFLMAPATAPAPRIEERGAFGRFLDHRAVVLAVWALLALAVGYIGLRVAGSSPMPAWPVLVLYALLVVTVLRTV